jgi:transposase
VVTSDGLPLAYEVLAGNTSDKTTLVMFLEKIQSIHGKARRVWVMDRGIPTQATLQGMRNDGVAYLVGTPKALLGQLEQHLIDKPWQTVHQGMRVKLLEHQGELYVLASSRDRRAKETAMRRRKLKALVHGLNRLKHAMGRRKINRDQLLRRVAVLRKAAGRVSSFVKVTEPKEGQAVNRQSFVCAFARNQWRKFIERDGSYIIRAWLPEGDGRRALDLPANVDQQAPVAVAMVHATDAGGGRLQDTQK